jgi:ABC-type hemin transport system ATPase subunit
VLVATSDLDAAAEVADRVVWLEGGRVVDTGPHRLLAAEAMCAAGLGTTVADVWRAAGLGAPYPATLAEAVRQWG